ncbi:MAG: NAD(P)/FAD-dependent oxidoreductase [Acidimicrobiia bacterium]|jgi:NADH dehydrogenase
MPSPLPRIVIVGGGFGGLAAAKALGRAPVSVTLVDRRNHHLFQPLLYQVATAGLGAIDIAEPIRRILRRQANTTVLLAEVTGIDIAARTVDLAGGEPLPYDHLIVAAGAGHAYFGHDEWEPYAPGLKTIDDALEIRRRILRAFEHAELARSDAERRFWLTITVVGGGPTGAELAGAIAELARHTLAREFRQFDPKETHVLLVEAGDRILPTYPPSLSRKAQVQLERLGVDVRTGAAVTGIDAGGVDLDGERVPTGTVVWAAGVAASPLGASLGTPLDRQGRVVVTPDLSIPDHPEVAVIGDLAAVPGDGEPVPAVAPAAIQMGRHAASAILQRIEGEAPEPFRYVDRGSMATLGRKAAVAVIRRVHMWGLAAWLSWLFVHIFFLIGFRNRAVVLFEWARSYLTYSRSARLILEQPAPEESEPPSPPAS